MLTVQAVRPDELLRPFIYRYVQRELAAPDGEFIEPVVPRTGAMLEFQFAAIYDVQAYGTNQLRPSWATTIIGPIEARRVKLIPAVPFNRSSLCLGLQGCTGSSGSRYTRSRELEPKDTPCLGLKCLHCTNALEMSGRSLIVSAFSTTFS